jgi:transcriptional regulator with XRE-family HTH domain
MTSKGPNENGFWLESLRELHESSGLSFREIATRCDVDHSYLALILEGRRRPSRDVLAALLAFGYETDLMETDRVLMLAGYPPFGRSARLEYRRQRGSLTPLSDAVAHH